MRYGIDTLAAIIETRYHLPLFVPAPASFLWQAYFQDKKAHLTASSLVETAKANGLHIYEYLEYVLTELAAHQDDTSRDFLADLLPWSKAAPKKMQQSEKNLQKKLI